jgi:hypothetical protein
MAKIKNTPYGWEFDVWCKDCKKVITVEGPEDLRKETIPGEKHPMFCLVCPSCKREIRFDGIVGHTLSPEFISQVQDK